MNTLIRIGLTAIVPLATAVAEPPSATPANSRTLSRAADIDATPHELFTSFTTGKGHVRVWLAAQADVDFRVGGRMRVRYSKDGTLDDPGTITNTILAYEPDRMIAIKPTAPAAAPPFLKAICEAGWNVVRFEPLADGTRTHLVVTGMGYGDGPEFDEAYKFFGQHNQEVLDHVKALYAKKALPANDEVQVVDSEPSSTQQVIELDRFVAKGPVDVDIHKEAIVSAPPDQVFRAFTTKDGFKSFLGIDSNVDLRIGGPMELYFGSTNPPGQRGSDGCQILSYLPNRMLSYSWNAPPKFPVERENRTWVVIHFDPVDGGKTRVQFDHLGFGPHGEGKWDEVRAYFDAAWPNVLQKLKDHFGKPAAAEEPNAVK